MSQHGFPLDCSMKPNIHQTKCQRTRWLWTPPLTLPSTLHASFHWTLLVSPIMGTFHLILQKTESPGWEALYCRGEMKTTMLGFLASICQKLKVLAIEVHPFLKRGLPPIMKDTLRHQCGRFTSKFRTMSDLQGHCGLGQDLSTEGSCLLSWFWGDGGVALIPDCKWGQIGAWQRHPFLKLTHHAMCIKKLQHRCSCGLQPKTITFSLLSLIH